MATNMETDLMSKLILQSLNWRVTLTIINFELTLSNLILVIEIASKDSLSLLFPLGAAPTGINFLVKFFGQSVNANWQLSHNNLSLVLWWVLKSSSFEFNFDNMLNLGLWLLPNTLVLKLERR